MSTTMAIEVLLVEDDVADIELTMEALKDAKLHMVPRIVHDGVDAMRYLKGEAPYCGAARPDLILLDLKLPRKDGREVLRELGQDESLRSIPVVVLTTSQDEREIRQCYEMGAHFCIAKPLKLEDVLQITRSVKNFWLALVKLPG